MSEAAAFRRRILVADDEGPFLKALATFLEGPGREILVAREGREALSILDAGGVEIVITDLVMPNADGMAILKRAIEIDPTCLVILMTGFGSIDTAVRAMAEGAFDYKAKPFLLEEVGFALQRAESHLQLLRERDRLRDENRSLADRVRTLGNELEQARSELGKLKSDPPQKRLDVLKTPLKAIDASSSYRQWEVEAPPDEDMILMNLLRRQGLMSDEQFDRIRGRLLQSRKAFPQESI